MALDKHGLRSITRILAAWENHRIGRKIKHILILPAKRRHKLSLGWTMLQGMRSRRLRACRLLLQTIRYRLNRSLYINYNRRENQAPADITTYVYKMGIWGAQNLGTAIKIFRLHIHWNFHISWKLKRGFTTSFVKIISLQESLLWSRMSLRTPHSV